jgi:hypothetical protein
MPKSRLLTGEEPGFFPSGGLEMAVASEGWSEALGKDRSSIAGKKKNGMR